MPKLGWVKLSPQNWPRFGRGAATQETKKWLSRNIQTPTFLQVMLDSKIWVVSKIFNYGGNLFKVTNKNNRLMYLKFSIKIPEEAKWIRSVVFIVDFEHVERTVFSTSILRFHLYFWTDFPWYEYYGCQRGI